MSHFRHFLQRFIGIFFLFPSLYGIAPGAEPLIKILISLYAIDRTPITIVLKECKGITIVDGNDREALYVVEEDELTFLFEHNGWSLNGKKLKIEAIDLIIPEGRVVTYNDACYEGVLRIRREDTTLFFINEIAMEKYVLGVIVKELYSHWSYETHKVFAVVARTYALYKIIESERVHRRYHIRNSSADQCYKIHKDPKNHEKAQQAVAETRGKVITWKKLPILAMYNACCGGVVPARCKGFDFKKFPYLERGYPCQYCLECPRAQWSVMRSTEYVAQEIKKNFMKNHNIIVDIVIGKIKKNRSGSIHSATVVVTYLEETSPRKQRAKKREILLKNRDCRKIFSLNMNHEGVCITSLYKQKNGMVIEGKGQGHHMGLCQQGIKTMTKEGKGLYEIFSFYYPHTGITQWYE